MSAQVCLTTVIEMLYRDILIYAKSKGEMIMLTEYWWIYEIVGDIFNSKHWHVKRVLSKN